MSTIQPSPFNLSDYPGPATPLDSMTPGERWAYTQEFLKAEPKASPVVQELLDDMGGFFLGAATSFTGYAATRFAIDATAGAEGDINYTTPLNLGDEVSEDPNSIAFITGLSKKNNARAIAQELIDNNVSFDDYAYVLSAKTYGEYQDNLLKVKLASEEAREAGSFLGKTAGFAGDTAALIGLGLASEPLFFAGMGARTAATAEVIGAARAAPRFGQLVSISNEAARAATAVSRSGLVARGVAIGLAEESAIQLAKQAIDPTYRPDIGSVVFDYTFSGAVMGVIGGFAGRYLVKSEIERLAKMKYQTAKAGDIEIGFHNPLSFVSYAEADKTLLAKTVDNQVANVTDLAESSWLSYVENGKPNVITEFLRKVDLLGAGATRETAERITEIFTQHYNEGYRGIALEKKIIGSMEGVLQEDVLNALKTARSSSSRTYAIISEDSLKQFEEFLGKKQLVDDLFQHFEDMSTPFYGAEGLPGAAEQSSLVLQTANEIRKRGGVITRRDFESIISDLQKLISSPPTRTNAKGKAVLDSKARLARLAEIINKRVPETTEKIFIPKELTAKLKRQVEKGVEKAATKSGLKSPEITTPSGGGVQAMAEQVPQFFSGKDTLPFGLAKFFNQAANVLLSNNPVGRQMAWMMFNARRAAATPGGTEVAQQHTIFERGTYALAGFMQRTLMSYRNGYTRFALNKGAQDPISLWEGIKAAFGPGSGKMRKAFDSAVIEQLRTGRFDHASDGVNATAKEIRNVLDEMHDAAAEAGVRGFQKGKVSNYFPRLYQWDKIGRLTRTAEGRDALAKLLEDALNTASGNRQLMMPDGSMESLADIPKAAKALAERLTRLANDSDLAPMLDIDQELEDALSAMLGPMAPSGSSRTPRGRPRIIMNEAATISTSQDFLNNGSTSLSLADLTDGDLNNVMKKYMTSVMGAVNEKTLLNEFNEVLKHYDIRTPVKDGVSEVVQVETFDQMLGLANRFGQEYPEMGLLDEETIRSLRELMSALRYEPLHRSSYELNSLTRFGNKALGVVLPMAYLSTGGYFGFAQMTETARVIGTFGLSSSLKQMPILKEMVSNWQNMDEGTMNFAMLMDQSFHPSGDRLRRHLYGQLEQDVSGQGMFMRGLNSAANFFSDITLLAPSTSFTQHLAGASALQHLYDVSKNTASRLDDATVSTLGLEPAQYDEIINWVGANGITRSGTDRVINLSDLNAPQMDLIKVFVDRTVKTRIQDMPTRGDFSKLAFTSLGRLFTQFRSFNLKGIDNFLYQNISRMRRGGKLRVAQEVISTMLFASLIQYARAWADEKSYRESGNIAKAKEIADKQLGVSGFIKGGLTGPSEFFLPLMAVDATWGTLVSDDPIFSPYRYSGLQWYGIPSGAFIYRGVNVVKDVYGATVGEGLGFEDRQREITKKTVHNARLLLWGQNAPIIKQLLNMAEEELAKEFQLRDEQPRRNSRYDGRN